ncbi:hypothetical protein CR513_10951, partial [Mucuna pruriens]
MVTPGSRVGFDSRMAKMIPARPVSISPRDETCVRPNFHLGLTSFKDDHTLRFIPVCHRVSKKVHSSRSLLVRSLRNYKEEPIADSDTKKGVPLAYLITHLQSLRYWGDCLKGQWHRAFERKHDNLLSILEVEVQPAALVTLAQYYDSPLRCFTFRDFHIAPTLEEYKRLLRLPLAESPHYFHRGQYPSWASVAKLLRVSESEMAREKRIRNSLEGV